MTGAVFSPKRLYRYKLWRYWGNKHNVVNFIMLNPSTADEIRNDPTVERCERRARDWGYGGLIVTNIFAIRGTDPKIIKSVRYPIGPSNNSYILECAKEAKLIVCAWEIMVYTNKEEWKYLQC